MFPRTIRRIDARLHDLPGGGRPRWAPGLAVAMAIACGAVILRVAVRMAGPTIHPDEFGFLTNGLVLIGRNEAPIPTGSFYPAGYGVITGLGALLTGSISGAYRFALLANLVLALLTAWVAARLATRGFGASRATGVMVGALVFVSPGTIVSAMFSWAETTARLAFLGFVYLFIIAAREKRVAVLAGAGLFTGLMPALHGRFVLLLPITCLLFAWWALRRDTSLTAAVAGVGATITGYLGSFLLNRFVKTTVYLQSYDQENRLLRRLVQPRLWGAMVRRIVGQVWYLLATSYGLVGVGMVVAVAALWWGSRRRSVRNDPVLIGYLVALAGTMAVLFTGGLQLLFGNRGDHLMYGRYVEMMVPALMVLGCVGLERALPLARRAWLGTGVLGLGIAGIYVVFDGGDTIKYQYTQNTVVFPNVIGVDFARYLVQTGLATFGLFFFAVTMVLWAIARRRTWMALTVLVGVFAFGSSYSGERTLLGRTGDLTASGSTVQMVRESGTDEVGFDEGVRNDRGYYYLRYKLHPLRIVRFDLSSPMAEIPDAMNCVYGFVDKRPSDGEWEIVAEEPVLERVLWKRVGSPTC